MLFAFDLVFRSPVVVTGSPVEDLVVERHVTKVKIFDGRQADKVRVLLWLPKAFNFSSWWTSKNIQPKCAVQRACMERGHVTNTMSTK